MAKKRKKQIFDAMIHRELDKLERTGIRKYLDNREMAESDTGKGGKVGGRLLKLYQEQSCEQSCLIYLLVTGSECGES